MRKFCAAASIALLANVAGATEGGLSNYIPGFYGDLALAVEPPEGSSVRNDFYYYSGDAQGAVRSTQVELDAEVTLAYNYTTFLFNPGIEVLGSHVAFGITPNIGYVNIDATIQSETTALGAEDDSLDIGDLTLSANFYWAEDKWNFLWANYAVAPVGAYDDNDLANTGLNYWTLETDFMVTYFDGESGRDYSVVAGYSYNTENNDTDYKSGDEFHIDYVFNQFLSESFAIAAVTGARAVVVYGISPINNMLSRAEPVDMSYQAVMFWGGACAARSRSRSARRMTSSILCSCWTSHWGACCFPCSFRAPLSARY